MSFCASICDPQIADSDTALKKSPTGQRVSDVDEAVAPCISEPALAGLDSLGDSEEFKSALNSEIEDDYDASEANGSQGGSPKIGGGDRGAFYSLASSRTSLTGSPKNIAGHSSLVPPLARPRILSVKAEGKHHLVMPDAGRKASVAGHSSTHCPHFSIFDSVPAAQSVFVPAGNFDVRALGYKTSKQKLPSSPVIYDCMGCDFVRASGKKVRGIIRNYCSKGNKLMPQRAGWKPHWGVPEVLVVVGLVPLEAGPVWGGKHPETDAGTTVIGYFLISEEAVRILREADSAGTLDERQETEPCSADSDSITFRALQLFRNFVKQRRSLKSGIAFKLIIQLRNLADVTSIPQMLHRYNGKPVLLTNSLTFVDNHDVALPGTATNGLGMSDVLSGTTNDRILELEFDLRTWCYFARSYMPLAVKRSLVDAELECAFLCEGRDNSELPEKLLACFGLQYLDFDMMKIVQGM